MEVQLSACQQNFYYCPDKVKVDFETISLASKQKIGGKALVRNGYNRYQWASLKGIITL